MIGVVPDRVRWAVDVVAPGPDSRVLEVGCGPGVAAALVCPRLDGSGWMIAADRSEVAVRRTGQRCVAHVESGRLWVQCASFAEVEVPDGRVDVAFSVNVNLFWTRDPGPELAVLRRGLAPGGVLHVLYGGAAPSGAERTLDVVRSRLHDHGWSARDVRGPHGIGVTARPL